MCIKVLQVFSFVNRSLSYSKVVLVGLQICSIAVPLFFRIAKTLFVKSLKKLGFSPPDALSSHLHKAEQSSRSFCCKATLIGKEAHKSLAIFFVSFPIKGALCCIKGFGSLLSKGVNSLSGKKNSLRNKGVTRLINLFPQASEMLEYALLPPTLHPSK